LPNLQTASICTTAGAAKYDFLLEAMQQFISTPLRAPNSIWAAVHSRRNQKRCAVLVLCVCRNYMADLVGEAHGLCVVCVCGGGVLVPFIGEWLTTTAGRRSTSSTRHSLALWLGKCILISLAQDGRKKQRWVAINICCHQRKLFIRKWSCRCAHENFHARLRGQQRLPCFVCVCVCVRERERDREVLLAKWV
jgi:hypothetical protein